jgi:putative transposase
VTKLGTDISARRYKRHRFPAGITAHAVWLYHRFPLGLSDVESLLDERGIDISFQTVSEWATKFSRKFADKWHLDDDASVHQGKEILAVAPRRCQRLCSRRPPAKPAEQEYRCSTDAKAAESQGLTLRVMVTDKLRSYAAAKAILIPDIETRAHKGLNN